MHVVECPKCHRKFKVAQPVSGAKMKCSRCEEAFVGSSREDVVAPPAAKPLPRVPAGQAYTPAGRSSSVMGPALLGLAVLMVAGVIVMVVVGIRRYNRPRVIEKDAESGQVISDQRQDRAEADRRVLEHLSGRSDDGASGASDGSTTMPTGVVRSPDSPVDEPIPDSDPKLAVSPPRIVEGGPVMEDRYAVGRIRSDYDVALAWVKVTVLFDDQIGPSQTYPWIPPGGEIRYSLPIGTGEGKITARAQAGTADPNVLVWPVREVSPKRDALSQNTAVYTGEFTNNYDTPATNVEVYVDYYGPEGIWGGRAPVGRLEDGPAANVGIGKKGYVRFEIPAVHAPAAEEFIARAKGEKY